jgi:hypothetical protein
MRYIRAYCEENSLKYYENAVIDLYDSMRRAQGLARLDRNPYRPIAITGADLAAPQPPPDVEEEQE